MQEGQALNSFKKQSLVSVANYLLFLCSQKITNRAYKFLSPTLWQKSHQIELCLYSWQHCFKQIPSVVEAACH